MSYRALASLITVLSLLIAGCSPVTKAPVRSLSEESRKQADVAYSSYEVQKGDTLYSIAFRYDLNYRGLAAKNGIRSPYRINIGQRLILSDEVPAYTEVIEPKRETTVVPDKKTTKPQQRPVVTATKPQPKQTKPASKPKQPAVTKSSDFDRNIRVKQWLWPIASTRQYQKRPGNQIFFRVNAGTDVRAVAAGRVVYSGKGLVGYGHLVIIKHSQNLLSAYAFNDKVLVKEKQNVKAGQKISSVGSSPTGDVGLGFEIRSRGKPVNPLQYLK